MAGQKRILPCFLLLAGLASLVGTTGTPAPQEQAGDFLVEKDVAVPMRDGVVLRADVWRPRAEGPFPVLVHRTPYDKRWDAENYTLFRRAVERGYAVVIQDVRGRYASEGEFLPYQQEGRDGYDTIEWAARQPWSNGSVGTSGVSYRGAVQWLAALERPPHLKAMVPAMTFSSPRNFFSSGGVFDLSWIGWIWNNIAPDVRARKNLPGPKTEAEAAAEWEQIRGRLLRYLPLSDLPDLRPVAPFYYEWLRHPPEDPWWEWAELQGKYSRVEAAVLNLSGWYDEAYGPEGAISNFTGLLEARRGQRNPRARLVIGPWVHGVDGMAETRAGEREFGPSAWIDYDELVLRWMDHHLRGIDNGVGKEKPVEIFVLGQNQWRREESWPLPGTQDRPLYLSPGATPAAGGRLTWEKPRGPLPARSFLSDPADPLTDPYAGSRGAHDYRTLAERRDVLIYDSEPMEGDLEVTGPITAEIYLSADAPDTDLWVRLLDLAPDGTAFNLMSPGLDVIRASYRSGRRREALAPGRITKLRLTQLVTSNVFLRGHRIRVQISTAFFPHFSHNLHTGKLEGVSAEMRRAEVRIHHGRRHPSRLLLPVVPE